MSANPFVYPEWRWEPSPAVTSLGSSTVARVDTGKEGNEAFSAPRPTGFTATLHNCARDGHEWRTVHRSTGAAYDMVACSTPGCDEVGWRAP